MRTILTSNNAGYRLLRTIIQGIIGVVIANLDVLIGAFHFTPEWRVFIVALVMAILSPVMSALGETPLNKVELPDGYFEGIPGEDDGEDPGEDEADEDEDGGEADE